MYYKIVTEYSFFTRLFDNQIDVFNIPYGTLFSVPKNSQKSTRTSTILINEHCLHFADGEYDTMLWHTRLNRYSCYCQIYKIEPIGNVIKKRCPDEFGIYQCGADSIKILEKQNVDDLYDKAIKEYNKNPKKYDNFFININLWKKHKSTVFQLSNYYHY